MYFVSTTSSILASSNIGSRRASVGGFVRTRSVLLESWWLAATPCSSVWAWPYCKSPHCTCIRRIPRCASLPIGHLCPCVTCCVGCRWTILLLSPPLSFCYPRGCCAAVGQWQNSWWQSCPLSQSVRYCRVTCWLSWTTRCMSRFVPEHPCISTQFSRWEHHRRSGC